MGVYLTDAEITERLAEAKPALRALQLKPKPGHLSCVQTSRTGLGSEYRIIVRQAIAEPNDFSIIVAWVPPQSSELFHLRRYNGNTHQHTNPLEDHEFGGRFHIHQATERYQRQGGDVEAFAEETDRYSDLDGAWRCMIRDCGFPHEDAEQLRLAGMDD